ncbi:MAG: metallophosphoesterase [Blautia sp.]|nr:metallophosphoesterase [Blautia sp.]
MKILVVSDTHGIDDNLEKAVYQEAPFDYLIHCGDVEGREIFIEALSECPCCMVAGNNDYFSDLPAEQEICLESCRIMVTHGHSYGVSIDSTGIMDEAKFRGCQAVFFGHTHKPAILKGDGILGVNPGSLSYPRQEGRRPSYAVVYAEEGKEFQVEIKYLL